MNKKLLLIGVSVLMCINTPEAAQFEDDSYGSDVNPLFQEVDDFPRDPYGTHDDDKFLEYKTHSDMPSFQNPSASTSHQKAHTQRVQDSVVRHLASSLSHFLNTSTPTRKQFYEHFMRKLQQEMLGVPQVAGREGLIQRLRDVSDQFKQLMISDHFQTTYWLYTTLSEPGKEAFKGGRRIVENALERYAQLPPERKKGLKFSDDDLKIWLIQMIDARHDAAASRESAFANDMNLLERLRQLLPEGTVRQNVPLYRSRLTEQAQKEIPLRQTLLLLKGLCHPTTWGQISKNKVFETALQTQNRKDHWEELNGKGAVETVYPWTDPEGEKAEQEKKAQEQKEEQERQKSKMQQVTDKLKVQATERGKKALAETVNNAIGNSRLGNLLGGGKADDLLKGLF